MGEPPMEGRENPVTRVNGIKANLDTWTNEEIDAGIDHAISRANRATEDAERLLGEAITRQMYGVFNHPVVEGEVG